MTHHRFHMLRLIPPICIVVTASLIGFGLSQLKQAPAEKERRDSAPLVQTAAVSQCKEGFFVEVDGEVTPYRQITLSAQVAGRIKTKSESSQAGSFVDEGELLMEIDPRDYELEIQQLQQTVKQASVSIEESDIEISNTKTLIQLAEDELKLLNEDVARYVGLERQNAGSRIQLDAAKRAAIRARNSLQTLKNQITLVEAKKIRFLRQKDQALANLEKATLDLSRTKITAPISGIVMSDEVEKDDYVQPGTPLVALEDRSKVEVRFNLQLQELRWLWGDTRVTPRNDYELPDVDVHVYLELDGHQYKWTARLARYDGAGINPETRTVPCIAIVDNPSDGQLVVGPSERDNAANLPAPPTLLRGLFVSLKIPVSSKLDLVQVPAVSLRPGNKIWIADDDTLTVKDVSVAYAGKDHAVLFAGPEDIQEGDRVITSPLPLLVNGMEIREEGLETLPSSDSDPEQEAL